MMPRKISTIATARSMEEEDRGMKSRCGVADDLSAAALRGVGQYSGSLPSGVCYRGSGQRSTHGRSVGVGSRGSQIPDRRPAPPRLGHPSWARASSTCQNVVGALRLRPAWAQLNGFRWVGTSCAAFADA